MADDPATARREARRRRILANSEDRMKKVLGQSQEKSFLSTPPPLPAFPPSPSLKKDDDITTSTQNKKAYNYATDEASTKTEAPETPASYDPPSEEPSYPAYNQGSQQRVSQSRETPDRELQIQRDMAVRFQRLKQILSVILAILVRIVLTTQFGETFVKSIFMPFMTMELALFQYQRLTHIDMSCLQKSSLWSSALMLAGMNPDILQSYNKLTVICNSIAEDFTLYFFTFVCMHLIL